MASASDFDNFLENQRRLLERLDDLRIATGSTLDALSQEMPGLAAEQLETLLRNHEEVLREQREQGASFVAFLRKLEKSREEEGTPVVVEKRLPRPRDQAQIEKISAELSLKLKLDRIDDAMKELLAFLADSEFFAENATTGRRRRLKTLQNAIQKSLA